MAHAAASCDGCGKANPTMQCPKCKELGLTPSYFCGQPCFKSNWSGHKVKHTTEKPQCSIATMSPMEREMFNFRGPLRPHLITPKRVVPASIPRPDYADAPNGVSLSEEAARGNRVVKWAGEDLDKIKRVCALSREVLDIATSAAKPGMTTDELDRIVHEATIARQMYPSPLGYYNFPKSVCTSLNEIICHGIPDARPLQEGDILNLDISSYLNGFHGDLNETIFIGKPSDEAVRLVHATFLCLQAGIAACTKGAMYKQIGDAIQFEADKTPFSVVKTYSGHGIGKLFHTAPSVPHYGNNKAVGVMQPGHVFTIEPMINAGTWQDVSWPDKWTASTTDGRLSAQFEQTMVVTATGGVELLTNWPDGVPTYQKQLAAWGIPLPTF